MNGELLLLFAIGCVCVLAGWLLTHTRVWSFSHKQNSAPPAPCTGYPVLGLETPFPPLKAGPGASVRSAEVEDELERARR